VKVCNATTALYVTNAETKSKEMVARSFEEDAASKANSKEFLNKMRQATEDKVKRAEDEADDKASEKAEKQCQKLKAAATSAARHNAARDAVNTANHEQAELKAKEAYNTAYTEAIQDGLSEAKAKELATEARKKAYTDTKSQTKEATDGIAPPAPPTATDLMQLEKEVTHFKQRAVRKRAKEAQFKKQGKRQEAASAHAAQQALVEASDAESDLKTVTMQLRQMQKMVAAQEVAMPEDLLSTVESEELFDVGLTQDEMGVKQRALAHFIAAAVKHLHRLGGSTPAEARVSSLQAQLDVANARIAKLEARAD
jgi:hypothetical protein